MPLSCLERLDASVPKENPMRRFGYVESIAGGLWRTLETPMRVSELTWFLYV